MLLIKLLLIRLLLIRLLLIKLPLIKLHLITLLLIRLLLIKLATQMFVAGTGDGWGDLARSLFDDPAVPTLAVSAFFFAFVVLVCWIMFNIVLAILLDEFR